MPIQKPGRMVLLALRLEHIDPRLLTSSLNLCKRLNAGMEILTIVPGANLPVAAREMLDALNNEQVFHVLTRKAGTQAQRYRRLCQQSRKYRGRRHRFI